MFKSMWQFIILAFFRRLANDGMEYCDVKVVLRGRKEKIHVFVTKNWKEGEEPEGMDTSRYLI